MNELGPAAREPGGAQMTSKADFTDEEWTRLKRAPFVAGMAISLADPGGPIEALKETAATLKTVLGAAEQGGRGELVDALAREVAEQARERKNPLAGFKPSKGATAGVEILDELREVNRIASQKATAEDAAALREWLLAAAQEAANAAKEGGFMGFRAERVSEGEQRMLDSLREVLAADPA
jgi:broad specificity phosphatase PhoE